VATFPKQEELIQATLQYLQSSGGRAHFKDIERGVIKILNIDESSARLLRSGKRTELAYRLSWARTKCKESGLVTNLGSGIWEIVSKNS